MEDVLRRLGGQDPLILGKLLARAVGEEDLPQLGDDVGIAVNPLKLIITDRDLAAAVGHDAPAEPLPCGQRLQPRQVLAQRGYRKVQHRKEAVVGSGL